MGCGSSDTKQSEYQYMNSETEMKKETEILQDLETEAKKQSAKMSLKKVDQNDIVICQSNLVGSQKQDFKEKYEVVQKIGAGSFGKVYKVKHIQLNQFRAMKTISKDTIKHQDDEKLFLKEIEVLSQLDHPNILKIYEYFEMPKTFNVITELCTGGELFDYITKIHQFSEHDAAIIMEQLFSCVFYLHSKGIVHRDLKPENILLNKNNDQELYIKLIDFGTSNYFDKNTKLTSKIGTAYYIAPEVINHNYSNKCDLWSLGVILYILLSGSPPFNGHDDNQIMANVRKGKYHFNDPEWEYVSKEAKELIRKLLIYDPNKRISAEEAWKDVWVQKFTKKKKGKSANLSLENLKNFGLRHKFQQATIAFLVHQASSTDMMKDLRKIFKEFDVNGDGQLSYHEIKQGFRKYFNNDEIADQEFDNLIKKIDLDQNKFIEYEEFLRVTVNLDLLITDQNLKLAFEFFDKDKSGKLTPDEIRSVLGIGRNPDNKDEEKDVLDAIIKEIDINGDGLVSFEEFKLLMVKVLNGK